MRAYGKNCLTAHAPYGALNFSIAAFLWFPHPFDIPRWAKHNKPLQKRLRGELEAVEIAEHSHSLYVIALCTFMRSTHAAEPGPNMHISVACQRKSTSKLTVALAVDAPSSLAFTSVSYVHAAYTSVIATNEGIATKLWRYENSTNMKRNKPQWNRCIVLFCDGHLSYAAFRISNSA